MFGIRKMKGEEVILTNREKEVLFYLCKGLNNVEIGKILNISKHTAKAHVCSILAKMGAKNRIDAAYLAGKFDFLDEII